MGKYRNRIEALEQVFVAEPDPKALRRVEKRILAGDDDLSAAELKAIEAVGSFCFGNRDGDTISVSSSRGQVVVRKLVGIAFEDV